MALRGLPSGWQGRRLLLMSDFHAGPFVSKGALERTIERLGAVDPDVVILAGDFVSASVEEMEKLGDGLRRLTVGAPTLGVLGNHDHYAEDIVGVGRALEALGVVVLHNQARVLEQGGDPLTFLGIDDWIVGEAYLSKVQRELPKNGPSILLSHVPDSFFEAADLGVDLVLAGHTHGGQIRLPLVDRLVRVSRYPLVEGHYEYQSERSGMRSQLILSQGLGVVGLPLRFRCPPEATLITLQRAE